MINISGFVFHIDEDAYLMLSQYLEKLKKHFSGKEDADEILGDIESRISEILQERLSETKQVVTLKDVEEVMAIMGQPVQFDDDDATTTLEEQDQRGTKRFYRNVDDRLIAGVCSGIASYFHTDPVWIRLIFFITVMAGGSGILAYLILWIVIPEAKTTAEKLEMRGERINISNIERKMREEASELRERLGKAAGNSAETIKKAGAGSRPFFDDLGLAIRSALKWIWKGVVFLTGIILMLFGTGILLATTAYIFGWTAGFNEDNSLSLLPFPLMARLLVGCNIPIVYIQIALMLLIGIPFFMLFYNGLRMVFRFDRIRHFGLTAFNIWIVSLFAAAFFAFKIYNIYEFREEKQTTIALEKPDSDTLHIQLLQDDPGMKYLKYEKYVLAGDWKTVLTDEKELFILPRIRFEVSPDSLFSVTQTILARGKSHIEALSHMTGIRYSVTSNSNRLNIGPFLTIPMERCWHGQAVNLLIRVPRGKYVHLDRQLTDIKPDWYYISDAPEGTTLKMTEDYLEETKAEE
jgi:phage shock protein PspC (stress-responsive transcriptional regulator)